MWGAVAERCINVGWTVVKRAIWERNLGGAPGDCIRSDRAGCETDQRGGHGKEPDHNVLCFLSGLHADFQSRQMPHGWLLGDAGYPCSRWLMTPIPRPRTRGECAFNEAHVRAWSVIERTFGVLKSCFRCLDKSGGSLMYSPTKVAQIVVACAVLHNLANRHGLPVFVAEDLNDPIHPQHPVQSADGRGNRVRGEIVNNLLCLYVPTNINTIKKKHKTTT
uniref:DDE Tnp4 domain-containing protein n=1 Tax=Xenopus tropicalis TaxID=8364 RepID=A0A803KBE0_XENTR